MNYITKNNEIIFQEKRVRAIYKYLLNILAQNKISETQINEINRYFNVKSKPIICLKGSDEHNKLINLINSNENTYSISALHEIDNYVFFVNKSGHETQKICHKLLEYMEKYNFIKKGEYVVYIEEEPNIKKNNKNNLYNKIIYGAPGTSKSFQIETLISKCKNVFRTTFHPDYSYSDFVGQYKPVVGFKSDFASFTNHKGEPEEKGIPVVCYDFVAGIFLESYIRAYNNPEEEVYLIIEEINRGNCAAIFGDIFQLLDRKDSGVSQYPISISFEMKNYLKENIKKDKEPAFFESLILPKNLYIWGTMNTSDQSLFPMDSAFKRRWNLEYSPINYTDISGVDIELSENNKIKYQLLLKDINKIISNQLKSEDKQMGQWFIKPDKNDLISLEAFKNKVVHYLYFDVFKHGRNKIFSSPSFSELVIKNSIREIFNSELKDSFINSNIFNDD